jgi:hypothetical protein
VKTRRWTSVLVSPALCIALAAIASAQSQSINIRAWIDGRSELILVGDTAQWHHLDFAAPGRLDCNTGSPIQPTYIQGNAWWPSWPDVPDCENRFCNCGSDVYTGVAPALPSADFSPVLDVVSARLSCSIIEYPSQANGFRVVIEFDDDLPNGADWYEVNLDFGPCQIDHYCTSTPNSTGHAALIGVTGSLGIADNDTHLHASFCPPMHSGIFFYGQVAAQIPMANGYLCISPFNPGLVRVNHPVQIDSTGQAEFALDFTALPSAGQIIGGSTWCFQFWYRDPASGGTGTNFSDAVKVTFCP